MLKSFMFNLMSFGQRMYVEKPLFVFYNNEGNRVYVISKPLEGPESKAQLLEFLREWAGMSPIDQKRLSIVL